MGKKHFRIGTNTRGSIALCLSLLIMGAGTVYWSRAELRDIRQKTATEFDSTPLYLPSAEHVRVITLGFDRFASDVLWFVTLNYFGKHFQGDKDYRWLGHMCDLVSNLDPKASHVYEFCTTLLSWVAGEPEKSAELLERAITHQPDVWRYHYLQGFNHWYFLNDRSKAKDHFTLASKLPDAPPFLASLASRLMVEEDDPATAIAFLKDLIERSSDPSAKKALRGRLANAYYSRDVRLIEARLEAFETKFERRAVSLDELVEAGFLKHIPLDPRKKPYYLDETGAVRSKSKLRGLKFFGKTAETGLAAKERQK